MPADGGAVTSATSFDQQQTPSLHYWPHFLPDGRHFIYLQRSSNPEYQGIFVASLDAPGATRLLATDVRALYASSHLLFMRDGLLFAQPFDERSLKVSGEPVRLADNVGYYAGALGYAALDASSSGAILYGPTLSPARRLESLDRQGRQVNATFAGAIASPRISSDGSKLLIAMRDAGTSNSDVWLFDLARGLPSRVTAGPSTNYFPTWMPDGTRVAFATTRVATDQGANVIFQKNMDGVGLEQPLGTTPARGFPDDVSPDGRVLLMHQMGAATRGYDLLVADFEKGGTASDYLSTPFNEVQARFSPDQRWVAYSSDESGRFEVYVRAFPSGADRVTISVDGGMQPEWRGDGKELFFLSASGDMMAVPVSVNGSALKFGAQQPLFKVDVAEPAAPFPNDYAVSADGKRFYVTTVARPTNPAPLTLELNWTAAIGRRQ